MKKLFLATVVMFALASFTNAQLFVGGEIGFGSTGGKTVFGNNSNDKTSTSNFNFSPTIGYILSDNLEVGLGLSILTGKVKTPGGVETVDKSFGFGLSPFARYYAVKMDKFGVFAQGNIIFNTVSTKTTVGGSTTDGPKLSTFGFALLPGVSFDLNDNVTLLAQINGLNLGFIRTASKIDVGGTESKDVDNSFGFGVGLDNIVTTGAISIGAIVKF